MKLKTHFLPRLLRPLLPAIGHLWLMPDTLVCPVYHTAWSRPPEFWNQRYAVKTMQQFEQDLDVLLRLADPVSLQQLVDWKQGRSPRPRGWFLSFDDGYRQLATDIAPLLQRRGIPATFFVCTSLVDNRQIFFEDLAGWIAAGLQTVSPAESQAVLGLVAEKQLPLQQVLHARVPDWPLLYKLAEIVRFDATGWLAREQPYLTSAQIRELLAAGFTIGAHSVDHPLFSEISPEAGLQQVRTSTQWLGEQFGIRDLVFAFPYGEFQLSARFLRSLQSVPGLRLVFGTRGIVQDELEPFVVQRMLAEGHRGSFRGHLRDQLNLQLQRKLAGRAVVRRPAENVG